MLLWCFVIGMSLGLWLDLLRLTRASEKSPRAPSERLVARLCVPQRLCLIAKRPHKKSRQGASFIMTMAQDVLFCLVTAILLILVLYATNDGQMRLSGLVSLVAGILAYIVTIGRLVTPVLATVAVVIGAILHWTVALVCYPVLWIARLLWKWSAPSRRWIGQQARAMMGRVRRRLKARRQPFVAKDCPSKREHTERPPNGRQHFCSGERRKNMSPISGDGA